MVNKNYVNGAAKERRLVRKLKGLGCDIAFRSAGSHSKIDVMGIDIKAKRIFLFQVKPKSMGVKARTRLYESLANLNGNYLVSVEVV